MPDTRHSLTDIQARYPGFSFAHPGYLLGILAKTQSAIMAEGDPKEHGELAAAVGEAMMMTKGEDRQEKLENAANDLRVEMEQAAKRIRELILAQPPSGLLGYLWAQFFLGTLRQQEKNGDDRPDEELYVVRAFRTVGLAI